MNIAFTFESKEPLLGPNFHFVSFLPKFVFQFKRQANTIAIIKAGGFFFYGFAQKLNNGNIDRANPQYAKNGCG